MSKKLIRPPPVPTDSSHPWASSLNRFAVDTLLRKAGFQIATRPKNGPTIWSKGGRQYTERQALKSLPAKDVNNALAEQDSYQDCQCEGAD